eukprot:scaffold815_cov17-Tisochrysis_lutea.AAC.1
MGAEGMSFWLERLSSGCLRVCQAECSSNFTFAHIVAQSDPPCLLKEVTHTHKEKAGNVMPCRKQSARTPLAALGRLLMIEPGIYVQPHLLRIYKSKQFCGPLCTAKLAGH